MNLFSAAQYFYFNNKYKYNYSIYEIKKYFQLHIPLKYVYLPFYIHNDLDKLFDS